jgi:hypothetical protein
VHLPHFERHKTFGFFWNCELMRAPRTRAWKHARTPEINISKGMEHLVEEAGKIQSKVTRN